MAKSPRAPAMPMLPPPTQPQQLSIAFDALLRRGITPAERARVLTHRASLLLLAAGAETGEPDDGDR